MDNMKQNTPVMELIRKIELMEQVDHVINPIGIIKGFATELLEQEKQMVVDAYTEGEIATVNVIKGIFPDHNFLIVDKEIEKIKNGLEPNEGAEDYYTTKYNQLK